MEGSPDIANMTIEGDIGNTDRGLAGKHGMDQRPSLGLVHRNAEFLDSKEGLRTNVF